MKKIELNYEYIYINEYIKNNKSIKEIAKTYNVNSSTISRNFKKRNLKLKIEKFDYSNVKIEKFKINTPELFYWLGFIAADGSLSKNSITIMLKYSDKNHLYKFKEWLNLPDCCITDVFVNNKGIKQKAKRVYFSIKEIYGEVLKYNIVPNKSNKNIDFLELIPDKYRIYFILGYFDGDGCVSVFKNQKCGSIGFVGNFLFISSLKNFFVETYNFSNVNIQNCNKSSNKLFSITWTSIKDVYTFSILYDKYNNNNGLERKRERLKNFENSDYYKRSLTHKFNCTNCGKRILNTIGLCSKCNPAKSKNYKKYKIVKYNFCLGCNKQLYYRTKGDYCSLCICEKNRKVTRPEKEILESLIKTTSFEEIGRNYGVSGNAVKKWCKYYGLPNTVKEINEAYGISKKTGVYVQPSIDKIKSNFTLPKSGYKNVYITRNKKNPYQTVIYVLGKKYVLGSFKDAKEAALFADKKLIELYGDEAITNKKLGLL